MKFKNQNINRFEFPPFQASPPNPSPSFHRLDNFVFRNLYATKSTIGKRKCQKMVLQDTQIQFRQRTGSPKSEV